MTDFRTLPLELKPAGGPFDDPALLIVPANWDQAVLFDCGTLHGLKTRDLQKVRWLFLTHLHIDHLIGFDHLLRVRLFSSLPLTIYGPQGTLEAIGHRLKGYAWNLTSGSPFKVRVIELLAPDEAAAEFSCHDRFDSAPLPTEAQVERPTARGEVTLPDNARVVCHPVRHGVPCLAFRWERMAPPRFLLQTALGLGLSAGPWVGKLVSGQDVWQSVDGETRDRTWLAERLLGPPLRHSLGYLTDTRLDEDLTARLADFFDGVDALCCETAYLESEAALAAQNLHMTTLQAAALAALCQAGWLLIFHLSRRHCEAGHEKHLVEVRQVFPKSELLGAASRAASETLS